MWKIRNAVRYKPKSYCASTSKEPLQRLEYAISMMKSNVFTLLSRIVGAVYYDSAMVLHVKMYKTIRYKLNYSLHWKNEIGITCVVLWSCEIGKLWWNSVENSACGAQKMWLCPGHVIFLYKMEVFIWHCFNLAKR